MASYSSKKYPTNSISTAQLADGTVAAVDLGNGIVSPEKLSTGRPYWASNSNVGVGMDDPQYKMHITPAVYPLSYKTVNTNNHAVIDGWQEVNAKGFSLGAGQQTFISEGIVVSGNWRATFTGTWENNYEGGGLVPTATTTTISSGQPYIYNGSTPCEFFVDPTTQRLVAYNPNGGYAIHFTGTITIVTGSQSYISSWSDRAESIYIQGFKRNSSDYAGMTGGLVLSTPCYNEYHFEWSGQLNHQTDLTCGSYQMSEIIYTSHQTNSGTNIHRYVRGKWGNNYTEHIWAPFEDNGNTWAMTLSITATDANGGTTGQSGRLRINETYAGGGASYSKSNLGNN